MNKKQKMIILAILLATETYDDFVNEIKKTFTIKDICYMLGINRNRYNYLKRTNQLNNEIAVLMKVSDYK